MLVPFRTPRGRVTCPRCPRPRRFLRRLGRKPDLTPPAFAGTTALHTGWHGPGPSTSPSATARQSCGSYASVTGGHGQVWVNITTTALQHRSWWPHPPWLPLRLLPHSPRELENLLLLVVYTPLLQFNGKSLLRPSSTSLSPSLRPVHSSLRPSDTPPLRLLTCCRLPLR